ncbi:M23 family metallopeptidase [Dyella sp. GSA-30]|uniref:M23 family metallopeptidase n=1 Tax=Dyella sp. GSA-30 TaxID=2994496 RepID=UPI00249063C0|nr:M23 family metallopeptidase [Dyella sp. GSA-30]BDU19628.1 hypothetical protein DYGSA30_10850 [Dyella sp. GSA-30]
MFPKRTILIFPLCMLSLNAAAVTPAPIALELLASSTFIEVNGKARFAPNEVVVEVLKQNVDGTHVMGAVTEVIPSDVHGAPTMRLFFAHQEQGAWKIGMEGSQAFDTALESMPLDVVSQDERPTLALLGQDSEVLAPGQFLNFSLPWAKNRIWNLVAGPHANGVLPFPYSSVDFSSGPEINDVRSVAAGLIYTTCVKDGSALVTIVHDNGYKTSYYRMKQLVTYNEGSRLPVGSTLGSVGDKLPCGGTPSEPHLHFTLLNDKNENVSLNNVVLGGWTFHSGLLPNTGNATHGKATVTPPDGLMLNLGPDNEGM